MNADSPKKSSADNNLATMHLPKEEEIERFRDQDFYLTFYGKMLGCQITVGGTFFWWISIRVRLMQNSFKTTDPNFTPPKKGKCMVARLPSAELFFE